MATKASQGPLRRYRWFLRRLPARQARRRAWTLGGEPTTRSPAPRRTARERRGELRRITGSGHRCRAQVPTHSDTPTSRDHRGRCAGSFSMVLLFRAHSGALAPTPLSIPQAEISQPLYCWAISIL